MAELSTKPYLIRAIHEWCTDCGYRPHIAVAVDEHTVVPREFVRNGEIVLNVSAMATNRLQISNELIEFEARFGGVARHVSIPIENVSAIYAQETGHGMAFEVPKALALVPEPLEAADATDRIGRDSPQADDAGRDAEHGSVASSREAGPARRAPRLKAVPSGPPPQSAPATSARPEGAQKATKRRRNAGPAGEAPAAGAPAGGASAAGDRAGFAPAPGTPGAKPASEKPGATPASRDASAVSEAREPDSGPPARTRSRGTRSRSSTRKSDDKAAPSPKADVDASATPPGGDEPSPPPAGRPRLTRIK